MKETKSFFDEDFMRISLQNRGFFLIIVMSVVPEPCKWDMIPEMAGTLVYERKNELCKGWRSFSFFVP